MFELFYKWGNKSRSKEFKNHPNDARFQMLLELSTAIFKNNGICSLSGFKQG